LRTPSWDEFREFLRQDGWEADRATGHDFFERPSRTAKSCARMHPGSGSKTFSPGRFKTILSDQLSLNEAEFWEPNPDQDPSGPAKSGA
jgi:hypothetical protein